MNRFLNLLTNLFPLWVTVAAVLALIEPSLLTWFSGNFISIGLGVIMLGMGLTLTLDDFKRVVFYPVPILTGVALQFCVMPFLGWSLGYFFNLSTAMAVGLVLVACCPGGTASNVVTYLAGARVALSVTMTAFSTLFAVILTPYLTGLLAGSRIHVDVLGLLWSTVQVVIVPVTLGLILNRYASKLTAKVLPFAPFVAVIVIALIVGSIIGSGKEIILESGLRLTLAIICLHVFGFLMGYFLSLFISKDKNIARTTSIEVGMQNSGLGAVLARAHFVNPAVAIPSAISSLTHCLIGSLVAAIWRIRKVED